MELREAILRRSTTNGPLRPDPVSLEHQHRLMEAASRAPSHFNSQPWRFVLITDDELRARISEIAGETMQGLMAGGKFFTRYRRYFRFSKAEMHERRDGIFIDKLPAPLRPFVKHVFSETGQKVMNKLGVPKTLGNDNRKLVAGSPLMLAAMLSKEEYIEGELSGFYSLLGLGMAIENIWLTTVELGMGIQFVSTPMEFPDAWRELAELLEVPDDLELIAMYRLGYLPEDAKRPNIDWTSSHRKKLSQYVFRNTCRTPEDDPERDPGAVA
ncbi:Nitroreductase family protein [Enhygromyxa salina]|uniref:Nitroreductase family protein n=1 Tax=Enhygromyxa salina TaxID=215803 RepID=A0A2S9YBD3_9BACT|nr:nitroreductase family protein [Enhygromyxa salina]PRQ02321.1 Nitroreductase family protein [Enhygromyxa salina]